MNILRLSWWATPVISFNWVRARDLAVQSKYQASLSKLNLISWLRGPDIRPMGQWSAEFYILQGRAYYELGEKNKAKGCFQKALEEMDQPNDYFEEEQSYLLCYILSVCGDPDLNTNQSVDFEKIDLDDIRGDLKMYYPLKLHPDWPKAE